MHKWWLILFEIDIIVLEIPPVNLLPDAIFADGFESGDLSAWHVP